MGSWFQTLAHASDLQSLNDLWQFALLITCRMIHWRNVKLFHCTLVFACRKTFFIAVIKKLCCIVRAHSFSKVVSSLFILSLFQSGFLAICFPSNLLLISFYSDL